MLGPEALVANEPDHGVFHRRCLELAADSAADFVPRYETGVRKDVEVLHHRRQRHGEWLGQFADREAVGFAEPHQQRATRGIGERRESAIERGLLILNHLVKFIHRSRPASSDR